MLKKFSIIFSVILVLVLWLKIGAIAFHYTVSLDNPLNAPILSGFHYFQMYADNPVILNKLLFSYFLPALLIFLLILLIIKGKAQSIHGDAKMASMSQIRKSGLLNDDGILVGKLNSVRDVPLMMDGDYHIMLAAPTRGGKGVSVVIPVALSYPESMIILDNKKEIHQLTSGFREESGHEVFLFNPSPSDFKGHCWNPLSYISDNPHLRIDDIQKISSFLMPTPLSGDPMWSSEARKLFDAIVLMLLDINIYPVTLGEVYRQVHTEQDSAEYFQTMLDDYSDLLDPVCKMGLSGFIATASRTRTGILSSLKSSLNLFANPLIDSVTAKNDFDLREIRRKKMTIYVCITPDNLVRLAPLANLFFQQVIDLNTRTLPEHDSSLKHTVLFLMDEFVSIGRIPALAKGIGLMAGYGLRFMPIIQSPVQLDSVYKEDAKVFTKNMHLKIIFKPIDMEDATAIANELGNVTVTHVSKSGKKAQFFGKSHTESENKRQLLLPQEVRDLKADEAILLHWQTPPIWAKRYFYYKDKAFLKRLLHASELPNIIVNQHLLRGNKVEIITAKEMASSMGIKKNHKFSDTEIDKLADQFLDKILVAGYNPK
jgi:type IV secretion system protein VirD4